MLINIGEIKDKLGVLTTISSNVSSILSKVNNLGSQKTYGLVWAYSVYANSPIDLPKAGLVIISNTTNGTPTCKLGDISFQLAKESTMVVPISSGMSFSHSYTGSSIQILWCPLS